MNEPNHAPWRHTRARDAIESIRAGAASSESLMVATLSAIADREQDVGAFATITKHDDALRQAAAARGPLAGLAVGLKDIFDTRELATGYGSAIYDDGRGAKADAAIVGLVRKAGGVIVGKTTTTEFAYLAPTNTRNPNAPGRTPGGSSAGSAAAVAAGFVPFAIGTQTGGSTIRPASYCGVVGFKPSFGALPTGGLKCFSWSLDTVGLFAQDVRDVACLAHALMGSGVPAPAREKPWRVAVPRHHPWGDLSDSASLALEQGVRAWQAAGAQVERVDLPAFVAPLDAAHATIQGWEAARALSWEAEHHADRLSPVLRSYLKEAEAIDDASYARAQALVASARGEFDAWQQQFDVLLTPSAPDEAPSGYASTGTSEFNRTWTLLGLPCVSVAGLKGRNGFPMGLQLVGARHEDRLLLASAASLEAALKAAAAP